MTNLCIDPNDASYREAMYAIDEALHCISSYAGQLQHAAHQDLAYFNERMQAIGQLSALCERLLGILRHYDAGSPLRLAVQIPLVRKELKRIRDSFRQNRAVLQGDMCQ